MFNYIDKDCNNDEDSLYLLYGIVNHIGYLSQGHYYSIIKLYDNNIWYENNDDKVIEIGKDLNDYPNIYTIKDLDLLPLATIFKQFLMLVGMRCKILLIRVFYFILKNNG